MDITQYLQDLHDQLLADRRKAIKKLANTPDGCLINNHGRGRSIKWYNVTFTGPGGTQKIRTYISKKDRRFAEKLAIKKYYTYKLRDIDDQIQAIDAFLKKYPSQLRTERLLSSDLGYDDLLTKELPTLNDNIQAWLEHDDITLDTFPEKKVHKTKRKGELVRSKSEALIANTLYDYGIPYKYECRLRLDKADYYPDFLTLNPSTGEEIPWEHFGMMDDIKYDLNTIDKIQNYILSGYIPGINLIMTFETKDSPLSAVRVEQVVKTYFG